MPTKPLIQKKRPVRKKTLLHRKALLHKKTLVTGLCSLLATTAMVGASTPAQSATDTLKVWAAQYMERGANVTQTEAIADARRFDILFAHKADYTPYVTQMKQANPAVQLVAYFNGTFAQSGELNSLPESDFAHDSAGRRIRHNGYTLWLMNPQSSHWVDNRVALCKSLMASSRYDGCGLDNIGPAPVSPGYTSALAINPSTRKPFTESEWITATTNMSARVKAAISPRPVYGNSVGNGASYFKSSAPTKRLLAGLTGAAVENFLRGGRESLGSYPSATQWKQNVDMLIDAGAMGKPLLTVTKTWNSGSQAQKDQWHMFALSTFMLGTNGIHKFWFTYNESGPQNLYYPQWDTNIGSPVGAYRSAGNNVYTRDFSAGKVVVNPDGAAHSVPLGRAYRNAAGQSVTSVTVPAHGGAILRL